MAIGDAMGMPVAGLTTDRIQARYGRLERYQPFTFPDGAEIGAGEFTDESEIALCIIESFTANQGEFDVANIGARMGFLARGESKRWMAPDTLAALLVDDEPTYVVPLSDDGPATGEVAARGIPIGMIHAVGTLDGDQLRRDAEVVTRLTHGSPLAIAATTAVAHAVQLAARREVAIEEVLRLTADFVGVGAIAECLYRAAQLLDQNVSLDAAAKEFGAGGDATAAVPTALYAAVLAASFEQTVFDAVNLGGATDTRGAIAGAVAGARFGAGGIPQQLIDELEGRIYVSLAAPWFYRTSRRRAGMIIDLRAS
jgi:ADP-ribosylglycohydrolase